MISPLMPTYSRADLVFERGEGAYLFTENGERYLDFAGGIAVSALGHSHPYLIEALTQQAHKVWHLSNLYQIPGQTRLAERLIATTGFAGSVFFGNSGAEAGELTVKMIRRYQDLAGRPERYRVITCEGAFHGRTLAMLAATGNAKYLQGFDPPVDGFDHVAFDDLDAVASAIGPETAGILVEPVQGEGGIRPASIAFLEGLRELADAHGLVLAFDEVQCGVGRTGKLWAHQWSRVVPDLMMVAKGLGGGFPIGAVLASEKLAQVMTAGTHGSTFGGNPLAMAVGNAVLDLVLAPGFLGTVEANAGIFRAGLEALAARHPDLIAGVRGKGLILGLQARGSNAELQAAFRRRNLLTITAGDNVVRIVPPLIIGKAEIDEALAAIDTACRREAA
jgi:acetylornithine/N-succinyldiaminopimelate aminotransferase